MPILVIKLSQLVAECGCAAGLVVRPMALTLANNLDIQDILHLLKVAVRLLLLLVGYFPALSC